jgi:hypothetical protein
LEAQALAKRGGCLNEDIIAIKGGENDLSLKRSATGLTLLLPDAGL